MARTISIRVGKKYYRVKDCTGLSSLRGMMFDKKSRGALIYANSIWTPFCPSLMLFFLDERHKVISSQSAVPLTLDPRTWRTYSDKRAKYCLEIRTK